VLAYFSTFGTAFHKLPVKLQGARAKKTGRREGRWGRFLPARGRKIEYSSFPL
jgi:hypothetical protein